MGTVAKYMFTILFLYLLSPIASMGQAELSARDREYMDRLKQELNLSELQALEADSIYLTCWQAVQQLNNEIKVIERSEASEKEISMRVSIKAQERRDLKAERDAAVQRLLSKEQLAIYEEKIKPAKPQVMHFGIHNRADCKICLQ